MVFMFTNTSDHMRLPKDIAWIKQHPGTYAVSSDPRMHHYAVVEVDENGQLFQLNPVGMRDGLLDDEGWLTLNVKAYYMQGTSEEPIFARVGDA